MNFQIQCCDLLNRFKNLKISFFKDWVICIEELKDQESWNLKRVEKEKRLSLFLFKFSSNLDFCLVGIYV